PLAPRLLLIFFQSYGDLFDPPSFPTRRSSDLLYVAQVDGHGSFAIPLKEITPTGGDAGIKVKCKQKDRYYVFVDGKPTGQTCPTDRKSTRLNSSHVAISYAVFCLTKKRQKAV